MVFSKLHIRPTIFHSWFASSWANITISALLCVVAIFVALPKTDAIRYNVDELGKPWTYPRLIAPFELPVKKSAERMTQEKDSTRRAFAPFFELMPYVAQQQIDKFQEDYRAGKLGHFTPAQYQHALTQLQEVYHAGIVSSEDMNKVRQDEYAQVQIVVGTTSTLRESRLLLTKNSAKEYLLADKTLDRDNAWVNQLDNYLNINLTLDKEKSEAALNEDLSDITSIAYIKPAGAKIIDRGDIITRQHQLEVESLNEELNQRDDNQKNVLLFYIGRIGLLVSAVGLMTLYLSIFRRQFLTSPHKIYLIFSLITLFPILAALMQNLKLASIYVIPFVMVPIVLRIFTDTRTAFMAHFTTIMIVSFATEGDPRFFSIQLLSGILAIYSINELTQRSQIVRTAVIVTLGSAMFSLFYELTTLNSFSQDNSLEQIIVGLNITRYRDILISGAALLFTYPLLYLIERIFGFTSSVTLIELSNINHPLLRQLSKRAQGTFVHSLQVGNLAAEVATELGANTLLVRTAALYHDIGKMVKPEYFTENQSGKNPHDELNDNVASARIIISHVTEGLKMAENYRLPKSIRDIIATHHGKSLVRYFYVQEVNKNPEAEVDKAAFTYPGPNPFTLEQAIIMMADSVEAASRSLKEHSEESISQLVNRIIDSQINDGAFSNCPITFRDIAQAKLTLIESLKIIYHTRITYPELNKKRDTTLLGMSKEKD